MNNKYKKIFDDISKDHYVIPQINQYNNIDVEQRTCHKNAIDQKYVADP